MHTLLLVHGGGSASSVWDRFLPELGRLGVRAKTVDLPGHGENRRRMWSVSLDDYADPVVEAARAIEGPVVAVGHSMGGFIVTAAAGKSPEAFDRIVYLAAFVPIDPERLIRLARGAANSRLGPESGPISCSDISPSIHLSSRKPSVTTAMPKMRDSRRPASAENPLRSEITKLRLAEGFAAIPKSYVLCPDDRAISPDYQRWMATRSNLPIEHEIAAGHMPMFSAKSELAEILAGYVR